LINAERSLEKCRGLGISVESKEKLSRIEGEVLNNQRGEAAKGKRKRGFGKTEAHGGRRGKEDGRFELCAFYLML